MGDLPADGEYQLNMTGYGARIFKRSVDYYLERWPGGDPEEQASLKQLQLVLTAIVLEDTIERD